MIPRQTYLEQLKSYRETQLIKVISGVRRCGKSTLFSLYQSHLLETGVAKEQIITLNLEDMDFEALLDYKQLYAYIKERLCDGRYTYVFIDEVQNCKGFEKVVDSLFIKDMVDVYITGSNAHTLSGELATLLSGRYVMLDMLPLSFQEFNLAHQSDGRTPRKTIVKTMAASIGSPISTKKITDTIASTGRKISVNSVDNYIKALCDAYIFYKVDRYDIKGRQYLKTLGKYYMVDTGLRNLLLSSTNPDLGHKIENVVYLELRRRGYKVNIGKMAEYEVDFVAQKNNDLLYVQVSASVLDETTLRRELRPLEIISDHHPKILLTLDEVGSNANYNGIRQLNLLDWLMG